MFRVAVQAMSFKWCTIHYKEAWENRKPFEIVTNTNTTCESKETIGAGVGAKDYLPLQAVEKLAGAGICNGHLLFSYISSVSMRFH